jgi:hypothetical protein
VDVEPAQKKRKRTRSGSLIAAEDPGQQISRDEFQELVRDLDVDGVQQPDKRASRAGVAQRAGAGSAGAPAPDGDGDGAPAGGRAPERDPAADLTPEDLVLKEQPKPREKRRRPRNKRHGRNH